MIDAKLVMCRVRKGDIVKPVWIEEEIARLGGRVHLNGDRGWKIVRIKRSISCMRSELSSPTEKEGERQSPRSSTRINSLNGFCLSLAC